MRRILAFLFSLALAASPVWAFPTDLALPAQQSTTAEGSHVWIGKNLVTITATWNAAVTARYLFVFDGTVLPGNGAVASCQSSYVTGCWMYCAFVTTSASAPNTQSWDFTSHPMGKAKFGLVTALSTGAGCGTLTVDGANDFFSAQIY